MDRTEKAEVIEEIKENINNSTAVYLVDYNGVNVEEINSLRKQIRGEGLKYKIYKNTFIQKALTDLDKYPEFSNLLVGMTGVIFADEENFVAPAKIIKKFNDDKKKFSLKGCYIDTTFYGDQDLKTLATMPTKEEVWQALLEVSRRQYQVLLVQLMQLCEMSLVLIDAVSKREAA
jgi:large subunit ribosomal protein L10